MATCIYCGSAGPFSDEHAIPACLGDFRGFPLLTDRICKNCNNKIGALEEQFCRSGTEAFFRRLLGIGGRKTHDKVNPFHRGSAGGRPIDFEANHPVYGFPILWELNPGDRTVRQNLQVIVLDESDRSHIIRIQKWMKSPENLKRAIAKRGIRKVKTAYGFADDSEQAWVESLLKGIGEMSAWTLDKVDVIHNPVATIAVTNGYFRAIAKCVFHYFLAVFSKVTGAESQFEPIRNFIINGGARNDFVKYLRMPLIRYPAANARPSSYAHLIVITWESGRVGGSCQFFIGPDYEPPTYLVNISDGVGAIRELGPKGRVANFFVYFPGGPQGRFAGKATDELALGAHKVSIRQVKREP